MKFIFCSMMFTNVEENIKNSSSPNSVSGHKFQENLLKGFEQNNCDISVINVPRVRAYPDYKKIIFHREKSTFLDKIHGVNIGFINLKGISYISQIIGIYSALKKELKNNSNEKTVLITFNSYVHTGIAMLLARRKFKNVSLCNVIGDLHGNYGVKNHIKGVKGFLVNLMGKFQDTLAKKYDCFVFLTKHMAEALNVLDKPHTVMECIYALDKDNLLPINNNSTKNKTIFYAGALIEEYGISHLLKAFSMIKDSDYRLIIAGKGAESDLVCKYASEDSRISYLGFISPSEVEMNQQQATVLVSPRTSEHEFVKYSFGSKTVECLASGKPYIAHKLPCDPPEYADYIQYAEDDSDMALYKKIVEICGLPYEERDIISQKGRDFVLNEKNPRIMCKRIVDMLNNII